MLEINGPLAFTEFEAAFASSTVAFRTAIPYAALLEMPSQLLNVGLHHCRCPSSSTILTALRSSPLL